jgi:hypothetical protein
VFCDDACRTYIRRNPGKGLNKVAFRGIFAYAWNHAATVGNAIIGFKTYGIFPFNRNQLPEHVYSPETVHVHSEVTQAEVEPQVISESQETDCTRNTGLTHDPITSVYSQKNF